MIYLDSNVFLYAILNDGGLGIASKKILTRLAKNEFAGCTSFLTWDEFVYTLKKRFGKDIALREGEKFLYFPNLSFLKVDQAVIFEAQNFMKKYSLNPRDAIHAASAFLNHAKEIISDDPDFDSIAELKRLPLNSQK